MVNSTGPRRRKSKKGREGPLRTATFADGLAIRGGAPAHEYEQLSNKVAHPRALSSLRCPTLIWGAARAVKQTRLMGDRAGKRKLTRPGSLPRRAGPIRAFGLHASVGGRNAMPLVKS